MLMTLTNNYYSIILLMKISFRIFLKLQVFVFVAGLFSMLLLAVHLNLFSLFQLYSELRGVPLTYFNERGRPGSKEFFGVWSYGQKGLFWVYERCQDFFWSRKTQGLFWVLYLSSNQINNYKFKCNLLLVWDFFG